MEANAIAGDDIIHLPSGTCRLTHIGLFEDRSSMGGLDILGPVLFKGMGGGRTVIDGNWTDRIFDILTGGSLTLQGVTVMHGIAFSPSDRKVNREPFGGGIRSYGGRTYSR